MRKLLTGLAAAGLVLLVGAQPAHAQLSASVADRPAATLLLPYFEVNYGSGTTTVLSVNNASANAVIAHFTVWTDLGVPVLTFDAYLTGYDIVRVDMAQVLSGTLPRTADDLRDPGDTGDPADGISNQGPLSQDVTFPSCASLPPAPLPANVVAHLKAALNGKASAVLSGDCSAVNYGDKVLRGYVTVDAANACSLLTPADPAYFTTVAGTQNVLWGDYYYKQPTALVGRGAPLVHINADATNPETSTAGEYTFYGRYVSWTAADNREPLATRWGVRYQNDRTSKSDITVWRDNKSNQAPFSCGSMPSWYPLGHEEIGFFDEAEDAELPPPSFVYPPIPAVEYSLAAATQKVRINSAQLPVSFPNGWIYLNLNTVISGNPNPPEDPAAAQAWVTVLHDFRGYKTATRAVQFDTAMTAGHTIIGF